MSNTQTRVAFITVLALTWLGASASVLAQVYGPRPGHDVIDVYAPKWTDGVTVQTWTGRILAYRVLDETNPAGLPQRTEIDFRRSNDGNRYTIYITSPVTVNGKLFRCSVPRTASAYRHDFNICPALPGNFVLNRTEVKLTVWFARSPIDNSEAAPVTDNIRTLPKA